MSEELIKAFTALNAFQPDQWADWVLRFLNDAPITPFISRGTEPPHMALNAIFDQLSETAKPEFKAGVSLLFPYVRPESSEAGVRQAFGLLKIVDHVCPFQSQPAMFGRLTSDCMRGIKYGGWDLHSLLLVACCHFGIDQRLEDYIFRSVATFSDFDYSVIAFRMLLRLGDIRPFLLLEHVTPLLRSPQQANRLAAVVLEGLEGRTGGWPLLRWLLEVLPRLAAKRVEGLQQFQASLQRVVPWRTSSDFRDAGALLVSAWLHARARYFNATELVELAGALHRTETEPVTQGPLQENRLEMLKEVLRLILRSGEPWVCIDGEDADSPWNRISAGDTLRILTYSSDGEHTDQRDLPRLEFLSEFKLLQEIVSENAGGAPRRSQSKRPRSATAKALAASAI